MTKEEMLRQTICEKYGSVLQFSKQTSIPNSTVNNILTRGLGSASVGTLIAICDRLSIDIEALMAGKIKETKKETPAPTNGDGAYAHLSASKQEFIRLIYDLPDDAVDKLLLVAHQVLGV